MDLKDPRLTGLAFRVLPVVQEVARKLGGGTSEAEVVGAVAERVKVLEAGLGPEFELISAVNWLGRVLAISRLDQTPHAACHPRAPELKIPDLIGVVEVNGLRFPLLIEVKRSSISELVWSEKYLSGLKAFAGALKIPLLVAWKHHHIWTLVDVHHFEKKVDAYHLPFAKAMAENLMSSIFGDFIVVLSQRVSFYIDAEVTDGPEHLPKPPDLLPEATYGIKISGAGFLLEGKPIELSNELTWAFFCAPDENTVNITGDKTIRIVHTPLADTSFSMTDLVLMVLLWDESDEPDWEAVVRKPISLSAAEVSEELEKGIGLGVVRYIIRQEPHNIPDFLK